MGGGEELFHWKSIKGDKFFFQKRNGRHGYNTLSTKNFFFLECHTRFQSVVDFSSAKNFGLSSHITIAECDCFYIDEEKV